MGATEILMVITGVIAAIYIWCQHTHSYWKRKGIPYIKPTALIGNLKDVFTMKTSLGLNLNDMYNDPSVTNEPVVGMYILNNPALLIREPELIKSILIKDFNKFGNRYSSADPHGDALGSYNLFFVRNPEWKEIRSKVSPVFTSGKIKQMYPLMLEVAANLEKHLDKYIYHKKEKEVGSSFNAEVKEICALFTTDLIATTAFGVQANSLQNPQAEFRKQGRVLFKFTLSRAFDFFVSFFLPNWVSIFHTKMFPKKFSYFMRETVNYVISERQRSGIMRNDLIDILLALKKEAVLIKDSKHFAKNNDFLVAQAGVFFAAGFETSSSTMSFALYELAKRPDLQDRLRTEISEALVEGKGTIPYEKIQSLEYLGMVIDEVLRLYPVLPFLDRAYMQLEGEAGFTLKPYHDYILSNGMPMYIPIYGIQRDPKYWSNPNTFDPERFSSENRKLHNPMTYLPFGNGPHNCIGSRIGLLQAKIGLVHFFKNHFVTTTDKTLPEMRFDPLAMILQSNGGIHLKVVNDCLFDRKKREK